MEKFDFDKWFMDVGFPLFLAMMLIATVIVGIVMTVSFYRQATTPFNPDNCTNNTYECRNHQLDLCIKSEQHTHEECVQLVGGAK